MQTKCKGGRIETFKIILKQSLFSFLRLGDWQLNVLLGCFWSSAAPLFDLTCAVGWSLVQHLILLPTPWYIVSLPMKTLWLCLCTIISLLGGFAHSTIKWYQTVLQSPVRLEFPNSIKPKSCTEGSLHHVRNIPVSGCFSPRQVILEQLAFPASSLLLWVVQHLATKRCFTKK